MLCVFFIISPPYYGQLSTAGVAMVLTLGSVTQLSFTAVTNAQSRRVMEKLGLERDHDGDFEHPGVPVGSPLRPHVLYRITRERYRAAT